MWWACHVHRITPTSIFRCEYVTCGIMSTRSVVQTCPRLPVYDTRAFKTTPFILQKVSQNVTMSLQPNANLILLCSDSIKRVLINGKLVSRSGSVGYLSHPCAAVGSWSQSHQEQRYPGHELPPSHPPPPAGNNVTRH